MKNKLIRICSLTVVVIVLLLAIGWIYSPTTLLEILLPDTTIYSEGYSEDKWKRISAGMSESEVISNLGPPIKISEVGSGRIYRITSNNDEIQHPDLPASEYESDKIEYKWLDYSRPKTTRSNYYVRSIKIGKDDIVKGIEASYYID